MATPAIAGECPSHRHHDLPISSCTPPGSCPCLPSPRIPGGRGRHRTPTSQAPRCPLRPCAPAPVSARGHCSAMAEGPGPRGRGRRPLPSPLLFDLASQAPAACHCSPRRAISFPVWTLIPLQTASSRCALHQGNGPKPRAQGGQERHRVVGGRKAPAWRGQGCAEGPGLSGLGPVPPDQAQWPQLCHEHIFRL